VGYGVFATVVGEDVSVGVTVAVGVTVPVALGVGVDVSVGKGVFEGPEVAEGAAVGDGVMVGVEVAAVPMARWALLTCTGARSTVPPVVLSVSPVTSTWPSVTRVEVTALSGVKLRIRSVPPPVGPPFTADMMETPVVVTTPVVLSIVFAPGWGTTAVVPPFFVAQLE
jgi:hypothetical protein